MEGKIALITGATSGIGAATAHLFAKNGWNIIGTGRREGRLLSLRDKLETAHGIQVYPLSFDITESEATEAALNSLPEEWRAVDLLFNNAGGAHGLDEFADASLADMQAMIDTNLNGLIYVTKVVVDWMIIRKAGQIINVSSMAGKHNYAKGHVYCAVKHAVSALTEGMRLDLLQHGIKVSSLCPGLTETEFSVVRFKGDEAAAKKVYDGVANLTPEDIAEAAYFMASRPDNVNIADMLVYAKAQAGPTIYRG